MAENLTEITCQLEDCIFYHSAAAAPNKALCNHKEAFRYVHKDPPCPLYRLDWQKKAAAAQGMFNPSPYGKKRRF